MREAFFQYLLHSHGGFCDASLAHEETGGMTRLLEKSPNLSLVKLLTLFRF